MALGQEAWQGGPLAWRELGGGFRSKPWFAVWLWARFCPSLGTLSSQHSTVH